MLTFTLTHYYYLPHTLHPPTSSLSCLSLSLSVFNEPPPEEHKKCAKATMTIDMQLKTTTNTPSNSVVSCLAPTGSYWLLLAPPASSCLLLPYIIKFYDKTLEPHRGIALCILCGCIKANLPRPQIAIYIAVAVLNRVR